MNNHDTALEKLLHDTYMLGFTDATLEADDWSILKSGVMEKATALMNKQRSQSYLDGFAYEDWEVGEDGVLRVGDYINCNHQRPHDGYERNFEGQIVEHYVNNTPVVLFNIDPKDPDNSGEFTDLQSLMMDGWTFGRIVQLTKEQTQ